MDNFKKDDILELVVHGNKMRLSQVQIWERDYGKFPTEGDKIVVTGVRSDGWLEIKCLTPNNIRQYWPPEYFKAIASAPASPRTKEEILDAAIVKMIADNPDEKYLLFEVIKETVEYRMQLSAMDEYAQPFIETALLNAKSVEVMKGEIDRLRGLIEKAFNKYYMVGFPHNLRDEHWQQFKTDNQLI